MKYLTIISILVDTTDFSRYFLLLFSTEKLITIALAINSKNL